MNKGTKNLIIAFNCVISQSASNAHQRQDAKDNEGAEKLSELWSSYITIYPYQCFFTRLLSNCYRKIKSARFRFSKVTFDEN